MAIGENQSKIEFSKNLKSLRMGLNGVEKILTDMAIGIKISMK
ncbi:hypothetical protein CNO14_07220 (plasmid) [Borrelia miyamotoi]|uniref:Uncharacterized protein n=2 Tax=Borrelia miyamotoi TaxID=47466 RepID=A0AAQ3CP92_9SPIR|nr:hypothetical protein [Borrelia miyamotoi]AHH05555.1 ERF superfamily protein [Borrelia miyamotoi FR64b]WAZ71084.1 hypothetical protein O5403_05370 [Borrelia miyamotoi]WCB91056.1 hypothetical protein CNO11_07395 [Borrelia miyamotoi]WCL22181.1 hypothetical protein CNO10_07375 [Borrelia miyamotoi]WDE70442.1 hypothetical protein CNO12_07555 [Borrelia miyamotoi]